MEAKAIASVEAVPWKNGGGVTRNLVVSPPDASLTDFDWRISIAHIQQAGPFSTFEGIDRTLFLWDGTSMVLHGEENVWRLQAELQQVSFRGEESIYSELPDGATTDLNVMTARARYTAEHAVRENDAEFTLRQTDSFIVLCRKGSVRVVPDAADSVVLLGNDFVHGSGIANLRVERLTSGSLYAVVRILPLI